MKYLEKDELKQLLDDQMLLKKIQIVFASRLDEMQLLAVIQKMLKLE